MPADAAVLSRSERASLLQRGLDRLSCLSVGAKICIVLLPVGLLPPVAALLVLHQFGPQVLQNGLALYIAGFILLYYPLSRAMQEIIVLRQARRINTYVDEVKEGRMPKAFDLPEERGEEHDFLRLQRNLFWMVQGLKNREARLQETLRSLDAARGQILESIEYASRIQRSFLPSPAALEHALGEHFLFWQPRDGVGGDAYWVRREEDITYLAVFDCTGHGVPGAFLTLIVNSLFEQSMDDACRNNPGLLLSRMNQGLKRALSQYGGNTLSDDGLEGGVCCIDRSATRAGSSDPILHYAGARGHLLLATGEGMREVRGDRSGIGFARVPMDQSFVNHTISLRNVRAVYLFTDGMTDQVGGGKRLPFGRRRLRDTLETLAPLPMSDQRRALERAFEDYKGRNAQRDDVTVLGFAAKDLIC